MNAQIAAKIAKFKEDIAASTAKRDSLVKEANVMISRITQLQGAVYALEELAKETEAPDAEIKK